MKAEVKTITTDAFTMDYCCFGNGSKPFVIIPGISIISVMLASEAVAVQYADMAEEYKIYLFDRRKDLPEKYSIHDMARDTAEAIRSIGLKDINLFGASQGGMISMVIAIEHPELVRKLILGSTSADMSGNDNGTLADWLRLAKENDKMALCQSFGEAIYPPELAKKYAKAFEGMAHLATDEDIRRFLIIAEGTIDFSVIDDLKKIKCPVLAIGSADDKVIDGHAASGIIEAIGNPDNECYIYDGYGHASFDTAPDYRERMMRFLK